MQYALGIFCLCVVCCVAAGQNVTSSTQSVTSATQRPATDQQLTQQLRKVMNARKGDGGGVLSQLVVSLTDKLFSMKDELHSLKSSLQATRAQLQDTRTELQAQQHVIMTSLNVTRNDLQHQITALSASRNDSQQVAFSVRFKNDNQGNGIAIGAHSTLKFDDVITNTGNGYNPVTGIFTAAVGGTYAFFLSAMAVNNRPALYLSVIKQGVTLDTIFAEGNDDNYDQGTTLVTTHVEAGDQVWVQQAGGSAVRGSAWTIFSGFLLHAD